MFAVVWSPGVIVGLCPPPRLMEIHHVVASLSSIGGPSYTVPRLAEATAHDHDVVVHTLSAAPEPPTRYEVRTYSPAGPLRRFGGSPSMRASLDEAARSADVIHSHGLWLRTDLYAARAGRRAGTATVLTPRGMLDPWAMDHHWGRKRLVWHTGQRAALRRATCIHATAPQERQFVRDLGFKNPVAEIPNGVDVPPDPSKAPAGQRTLLYLSRVHPKKGVLNLVDAWHLVQDSFAEWDLVIAGPDDGGHLVEVTRRIADRGADRVRVLGEVPEERKEQLYREAELYVLPTFNENWGVTVADALAFGVPAIVGLGAPWSGLHDHRCGWWTDNGVGPLAETLAEALARPPDALREMGMRGRRWVEHEFGWDRVGEQMGRVYEWVAGRAEPPACVYFD